MVNKFKTWVGQAHNGDISLEHDLPASGASQAISALDVVVQAGFNIKPIVECLGANDAYSDGAIPTATFTPDPSAKIDDGLPTNSYQVTYAPKAANHAMSNVPAALSGLLGILYCLY